MVHQRGVRGNGQLESGRGGGGMEFGDRSRRKIGGGKQKKCKWSQVQGGQGAGGDS